MYRKDVNTQSPIRILERSIHGGLGPGNLGVVMARAGVGKTAFLVQIGLDDAMRDRSVLHVAQGQTLDHVLGWYDAAFLDVERRTHLEDVHACRDLVARRRLIQAFPDQRVDPARLRKVVDLYAGSIAFSPSVILIDGWEWQGPTDQRAAELAELKQIAKEIDAELWLSAQTHREETSPHPTTLTPPCADHAALIDVAVFLEPLRNLVTVRLLKDHENPAPADTHLELDPDTLRLASEGDTVAPLKLAPRAYTLLSGGYRGAEAAFGAAAEKWGVREINYTFPGRTPERNVAVVELTEAELHLGDVSPAYVESHLHRKLPDTSDMRRVLQTVWHQVTTAGQVFVVGRIDGNGCVHGGTGWAAELARHFHKPVFVFDQERRRWFAWRDGRWVEEPQPRITRRRFCGTGSRELSDVGRSAIDALFEASFGDPPVRS